MSTSTGGQPELAAPVIRPPWGLLVWYCYGGHLPAQYHPWVLHDVTCRTWALRHFARWMMVIVPAFCLFVAFMPTPIGARVFTGIAISGGIFMFALVNIMVDTDRRAVRAGHRFSLPSEIRGARSIDRQRLDSRAHRERIAARQARRG